MRSRLVTNATQMICSTTKPKKIDCAPSKDSDQPGHPPSLIRVFAVRMKKPWAHSFLLSAQRRLLSVCLALRSFSWFCRAVTNSELDTSSCTGSRSCFADSTNNLKRVYISFGNTENVFEKNRLSMTANTLISHQNFVVSFWIFKYSLYKFVLCLKSASNRNIMHDVNFPPEYVM